MLRSVCARLSSNVRTVVNPHATAVRSMSAAAGPVETDEEFDARYVAYFNRKDIDGWEFRKAVNDLTGMDMVMDPQIIIAALHAARRLNDYALTTRLLEAVHFRSQAGPDIWPYIMQEIGPTLKELGISTLEEMGYDKPELNLERQHKLGIHKF